MQIRLFSKLKIHKLFKAFYTKNTVFSWMLIIIIIGVLVAHSCIIYNSDEPDYPKVGKVWEIANSLLTAAYTIWFWFIHKKGIKILDEIKNDEPLQKTRVIIRVALSIVALVLIVTINLYTFSKSNIWWHGLTLLLMLITFSLFCWIDILIRRNHNVVYVRKDFKHALNNSDIPGVISFSFLILYFLIFHNYSMELFFSGAIAFQMLFSSFIWANTDITNE